MKSETRGGRRRNVGAAMLVCCTLVLSACIGGVPEKVVLTNAGSDVELISEPPNLDVYVEIGEVTSMAMSMETAEAQRQARNGLRNAAATKNGTIVRVDDVSSSLAWDVGKTVVKITGTAYRAR